MANTLGIKILDTSTATRLDQPMTDIEIKQAWCMATFRCRCPIEGRQARQYGERSFCLSCSYLIHRRYDPTCQGCPTCHANESWQSFNAPCLACQLATITYQNPWVNRYNKLLDLWLNVSETDNSDTMNDEQLLEIRRHQSPGSHSNISEQEMLVRRNQTFENSLSEMRARTSRAETKIVFENLSQLQESFKLSYRTLEEQERSDDMTRSIASSYNNHEGYKANEAHRIPLGQLDINSINSRSSNISDMSSNKTTTGAYKWYRADCILFYARAFLQYPVSYITSYCQI
jgi:hypothetical protein